VELEGRIGGRNSSTKVNDARGRGEQVNLERLKTIVSPGNDRKATGRMQDKGTMEPTKFKRGGGSWGFIIEGAKTSSLSRVFFRRGGP